MTLPNFTVTSYEMILSLLRTDLPAQLRERLKSELHSRDRASHNQWVAINGGEFK
jgi:hypothetical protein